MLNVDQQPDAKEPDVKFQIKKTSNDQYRFNIVATNGYLIANVR